MAVIVISMVIVEMKEDFYSPSLLSFLISVPKLFIKALVPRVPNRSIEHTVLSIRSTFCCFAFHFTFNAEIFSVELQICYNHLLKSAIFQAIF